MSRDATLYLEDIAEAAAAITRYVAGIDTEAFAAACRGNCGVLGGSRTNQTVVSRQAALVESEFMGHRSQTGHPISTPAA